LFYRTHYEFAELKKIPSDYNKLIFITRNPKELLYRKFFLSNPETSNPDQQFIEQFLNTYLEAFNVYYSWSISTRMICFYEDFIVNDNELLLQLLEFMGESPAFYEDFIANKQTYLNRLLKSYSRQHVQNSGGKSSRNGPKAIYYSENANPSTLRYVDHYIKTTAPAIWDNYLKRFETADIKEIK